VRLRLLVSAFDDQRHATRAVALVADLVVVGSGVRARAALDARSMVSRVILFSRAAYRRPQARIGVRIGRTEPRAVVISRISLVKIWPAGRPGALCGA